MLGVQPRRGGAQHLVSFAGSRARCGGRVLLKEGGVTRDNDTCGGVPMDEEEMLASSQYLSVEFDWIGCEWIGCIRVWRHQNIGVC